MMSHIQQKISQFFLLFILSILHGCSSPDVNMPLKSTYWSLSELNGKDAIHFSGQPEVHLIFHINDQSFHGSDGCNRIQGNYSENNAKFTFDRVVTTHMSCQEGKHQADAFYKVLYLTDQIKIEEDMLVFYISGNELARFIAKDAY